MSFSSSAGTSIDILMAEALADELDYVERVDRLATIAESRRNASLREIDRRRPLLAELLRRSVHRLIPTSSNFFVSDDRQRRQCGVTSELKVKANRANSRASTGRRTQSGRVRAARNALRHGLSLPVCSDPVLSEQVDALAREIAGSDANAEIQIARA